MLLLVLQILCAASLLLLAAALVAPNDARRRLGLRFPGSLWLRGPLAVAGLIGAAATALSVFVPFLAFFAACIGLLVGASTWIVAAARGGASHPVPAVALVSALGIAALQPLGLKVLALPTAAKLPYRPAPAELIKTYPEGVGFESVRAGPDGSLYLAANKGLDFSRGDYYRDVQATVIKRSPDGSERVLFALPKGATAGVFAVAPDGVLYMTSNGRAPGIWRIDQDSRGVKIAELPSGAWPNGLDFGPDGKLYSPDSALGLIWRIDSQTGRAERALVDKRLSARAFISLAPGANGLHFLGRTLYVTVSDRAWVLKYDLNPDGRFGPAAVVARGIPGDDFAIGPDGSLFVTTHPYNTVVRVSPSGERSVVADARQHILGATDAVFGRGSADRDVLYVATDGGAFQNGPKSRGALIALRPYAAR